MECSAELRQHIGTEIFLLSCKVTKFNKYGWRNTRTLALTQDTILILKNKCKELRRKVNLQFLRGLTMSLSVQSKEMVIHVEDESDIRLASQVNRKQIIDTIKMFYATKTRENLPIYGVR